MRAPTTVSDFFLEGQGFAILIAARVYRQIGLKIKRQRLRDLAWPCGCKHC